MATRLVWIGLLAGAIGLSWIGLGAGQAPPASTAARPEEQKPQKPAELAVGEEAIRKALDQRVSLEFVDTPLADVVSFLEQLAGIQIEFDRKALDDAGVATDTTVTRHVRGVTLRSALALLLRDVGLRWTIRDEVLMITSPDEAQNCLAIKVYEVADLARARDEKNQPYDDYDTLIDVITKAVEPTSWDVVGGPGSITGATFGSARVLVVSQTYPCQEEIARLFKELRAVAPPAGANDPPPIRPRRPPPVLQDGLPPPGAPEGGGVGMFNVADAPAKPASEEVNPFAPSAPPKAKPAVETAPFADPAPKPKPAPGNDPFGGAAPAATPKPKPKPAPEDDPFGGPPAAAASKPMLVPEGKGKSGPGPKPGAPKAPTMPSAPPRTRPAESELTADGPSVEKIEKALDAPTALDFIETPLNDVMEFLQDSHKIPILIDKQGLKDAGIDAGLPVTLSLKGVSLRSALDLMLRQHGLTWTVRSQSLVITTPEEAENLLAVRIYDVADLVQVRDEQDALWEDYDTLIDAITTTVAPSSWSQVGGAGSIVGGTFGGGKVIVVSQTWRTHEQVKALLEELRKFAKTGKDQKPPMRPRPPAMMGGGWTGGMGMGMGGMGGMGMGGLGMPGMMPPGANPGAAPKPPSGALKPGAPKGP